MKQSPHEILHKWDTKPERRVKGLIKDIESGRNAMPAARRIAWILAQLEQPATVLDVGAGSGHLVWALNRAGYSAAGIEPHERAVELSKRYTDRVGQGSVYDEIGDSTWGTVVMAEVIEHLQWPELALRRIASKATAQIILTTPAAQQPEGKGGRILCSRYHLREWTPSEFTEFVEGMLPGWECRVQEIIDGEIRSVFGLR